MKRAIKSTVGVVLIALGFLALITPLSPGSWLILVGLEVLGLRILLERRLRLFAAARPGSASGADHPQSLADQAGRTPIEEAQKEVASAAARFESDGSRERVQRAETLVSTLSLSRPSELRTGDAPRRSAAVAPECPLIRVVTSCSCCVGKDGAVVRVKVRRRGGHFQKRSGKSADFLDRPAPFLLYWRCQNWGFLYFEPFSIAGVPDTAATRRSGRFAGLEGAAMDARCINDRLICEHTERRRWSWI